MFSPYSILYTLHTSHMIRDKAKRNKSNNYNPGSVYSFLFYIFVVDVFYDVQILFEH